MEVGEIGGVVRTQQIQGGASRNLYVWRWQRRTWLGPAYSSGGKPVANLGLRHREAPEKGALHAKPVVWLV